jgi:hypothetical protein
MSISNDTPGDESTPHEFATHEFAQEKFASIERTERPFELSAASKPFGISGIVLATVFFTAILIIGVTAQRSLNQLAPNRPAPTTGMVIDQSANTPSAAAAFPTVYVLQSADPSQAPSPLPETPSQAK